MTLTDLEAAASDVEQVLDRTPEVDPWCSGPDWVLSVREGFAPDSDELVLRMGDGAEPGYALLASYRLDDGRVLIAGLEPLWGFATPVFGPNVDAVGRDLCTELRRRHWHSLVLPGIPPPAGPESFAARLAQALSPLGTVRAAEGIVRQVADIGGGTDEWLGRRSARFRRSLRQAQRRAAEAGLQILDTAADTTVFERMMAIENQSWKGMTGSGITTPEMETTYRTMVDRLRSRGRLRVGVATVAGNDVGYILGGVRGRRYRGLQLSFADDARPLSVGHLLQAWQIAALEPEHLLHYDLGMDMAYKRRWADRAEPSLTFVVDRI